MGVRNVKYKTFKCPNDKKTYNVITLCYIRFAKICIKCWRNFFQEARSVAEVRGKEIDPIKYFFETGIMLNFKRPVILP